jgi:hypothetical protein
MFFIPAFLFSLVCNGKELFWIGFNKYFNGFQVLIGFLIIFAANIMAGPLQELSEKIISNFFKKYSPKEIQTYSDNLISSGDLYKSLGFENRSDSKPGYYYVINGIREHRFNWRKQRLIKMGYDKSKTEEEIMSELGHWRIYNAGNKKWVWQNKTLTQKKV